MTKTVNVKSLTKLTGSDVKAYYYDGSVYKVCLLGDDGNPLANVAVTIKINGKKVATPKTDKRLCNI